MRVEQPWAWKDSCLVAGLGVVALAVGQIREVCGRGIDSRGLVLWYKTMGG